MIDRPTYLYSYFLIEHMLWIFVRIASVQISKNMLLEILMQCSCIISHSLPSLERRFRDIQIVIITNFVFVSSVGTKRVDCINNICS